MSWIDEAEELALAATPGPWVTNGRFVDAPPRGQVAEINDVKENCLDNAAHIANWSPDRALKVLAVLRAASELVYATSRPTNQCWTDARHAVRAALAALEDNP